MPDYIPTTDADFNTWQAHFLDYINANLAALNLTTADVTSIMAAQSNWTTAYTDHIATQAAAQGASQAKKVIREDYQRSLRALAQQLQARPNMTVKHRAGMGVNIRSTTRTPIGIPQMRPVATIDTSQRLRHKINFSDEATPSRRAKPANVIGCEIWVKIGDPAPVDPSQLKFLATDTATPYTAVYDGADAGKTAHYMLRWVNRKGEAGPWSQTVSATIIG